MGYGRPMKGASRRIPVTVHLTVGALDIIDNYLDDHEKGVEKGRMSRSDFINEAVRLPCGTGLDGGPAGRRW